MVDAPRNEAVQSFPPVNAIDTCAVWNILSSKILTAAVKGRAKFVLAEYVRYECLTKFRKNPEADADLRERLSRELASGEHFRTQKLEVGDLQELVASVGSVSRFHRGELAALALARRHGKGFMTDDRIARKIGEDVLGTDRVRTTPHLVGWLSYGGFLTDGDIPVIIADNHAFRGEYGKLGPFIYKCYEHAMGLRLYAQQE